MAVFNFSFGINNGCYWSVLSVSIVKISAIFLKKKTLFLAVTSLFLLFLLVFLKYLYFQCLILPPKLFHQAHEVLVSITVALRR